MIEYSIAYIPWYSVKVDDNKYSRNLAEYICKECFLNKKDMVTRLHEIKDPLGFTAIDNEHYDGADIEEIYSRFIGSD